MSSPAPDWLIGGRFRVERVLGAGGMGSVYLARNLGLDQLVALKVLHPDAVQDGVRHSRLIREARAAASIQSAHVVRVIDVVGDGPDAPFVVMEYLEGETLRSMLERRNRLPLSEVMELVSQVAEAVGEGHALGIVHRDLKPENLFRVQKPGGAQLYKVLDFGISKVRREGAETLTSSRQVLASPAYAAPEQLRASRNADVPADIWSLGVVMYECLVGERPFTGETLGQLCVQILEDTPAPPSKRVPGLWPTVDEVVMRCLEKDPKRRFSSIAELLSACVPLAPSPCSRALAYLTSLASDRPVRRAEASSSSPSAEAPSDAIPDRSAPAPTVSADASAPSLALAPTSPAAKSQTLTATELAAGARSATPNARAIRPRWRSAVLFMAIAGAGAGAVLWNASRSRSADRNSADPAADTRSTSPAPPISVVAPLSAPAVVSEPTPPPAASSAALPLSPRASTLDPAAVGRNLHKKIPTAAPSAKNSAASPPPSTQRWVESR